MRFSTTLVLISAIVYASAAPVPHASQNKGSEVDHRTPHAHDSTPVLHTHAESVNTAYGNNDGQIHPRSMQHMNELEARSKTGKHGKKGHHKGKHHGKKHHKKGKKHGKHHKKHAKKHAQAHA